VCFHPQSAVKPRGSKVNSDTALPMIMLRGKDRDQKTNAGCIDSPLTTLFLTLIIGRGLVHEIGK
jgi:hypothetical protein